MSSAMNVRITPGPMTDNMLDAAIAILAEAGEAGLTLAGVARRMGVSSKPVRTRVTDPADLMAAVWRLRLGELMCDDLARCVEALTEAQAGGDARALRAALARLLVRSPQRDAATELLLVARFHEDLNREVDATLGEQVRQWLATDEQTAASRAFLLCLAFGMLIMARSAEAAFADLDTALPTWTAALLREQSPTPLPRRDARHMDDYPDLAPGDPSLHILLNTALEQIGAHGFENLTVAEIASRAGFTEGLVFSRYATKLEMFTDATRRQNEAGWQLNHDYVTALERDFEKGIAEAIWIREVQKPGRQTPRSLQLEQIHLSWHHPELADAQASARGAFREELLRQPGWATYETETDFFLQVAFSLGTYLLPFFAPPCHRLPYDTVTVPLYEAFEKRTRPRKRQR